MRIVIFEGIATTGKTTLARLLQDHYQHQGLSCQIIDEAETLLPVLENRDVATARTFLTTLLEHTLNSQEDLLIFDRLYFTHALMTTGQLVDFTVVEEALLPHNPLLILLTVPEENIPKRISDAMQHRDPSWEMHVRQKGDDQQIAAYYIQQQRSLLSLYEQSALPKYQLEIASSNYSENLPSLLSLLNDGEG